MKALSATILFAGLAAGQNISDVDFAKNAAIGGMAEVQLGKLAAQKGASEQVKSLGQRIVDDHTNTNDQLKSIAAKDNLSLPSDLDAKHQAMVEKFSKLSGSAFDREYLRTMKEDHEADIRLFRDEALNGANPDLKNFASSNLPALQDHLQKTENAQQTVNKSRNK